MRDDAHVDNDTERENQVDLANADEVEQDADGYGRRKRKKTSTVWNDFKVVPGSIGAGVEHVKCMHCHAVLKKPKSGATTTFERHLKSCPKRHVKLGGQQLISLTKVTPTSESSMGSVGMKTWQYDQSMVREILSHMIMVHELPFAFAEYDVFNHLMKATYPEYKSISRFTLKNDCITSYEIEKKRTLNIIKNANRVGITTDIWRSKHQKIEYMVVTCHFISDFQLHKRVINFVDVPHPHTGVAVYDALYKCLEEWGIENNLATITVDNASYNDVVVRMLKENLSMQSNLPYCGGKLFHVRCCAHILNILVQYGLDEINDVIKNVRESVKYITASPGRISIFSEIAKQLRCPGKKLILDCSTRWNATHAMLSCALEFKRVFPQYQKIDHHYKTLPSTEDFEKAEQVCKFLELFSVVTNIISGSQYPTANLFITELKDIKELLDKEARGDNEYLKPVATKMKEKFDKYWSDCNLLISIAAVLDPRVKMKCIDIIFKSLYSESEALVQSITVRENLNLLYQEYVDIHASNKKKEGIFGNTSSIESDSACITSSLTPGLMRLQRLIQDDTVENAKSEIDIYLEEGVYMCKDGYFDIIRWWKENSLKFKILSKMACDILSIPITTVASESTFSAGGRVIDNYRASLGSSTVQMLLCGEDWLRNFYGINRNRTGNDLMETPL